jgi:hypothetical protein
VALKLCVCPIARAWLSTDQLAEPLFLSLGASTNHYFRPTGTVGPGTWPVHGCLVEPLCLSVGAWANCWFSALVPA